MMTMMVYDDNDAVCMQAESIAESVKTAAESAMQESQFIYDPETGFYYDYVSGQYYDAVCILTVFRPKLKTFISALFCSLFVVVLASVVLAVITQATLNVLCHVM